MTGDFNAEPLEPVHSKIRAKFDSVYQYTDEQGTSTTWTKRQSENEIKRALDYIYVSKDDFQVNSLLSLHPKDLMDEPLPNKCYPSDHLSLIARLTVNGAL